MSVAQKEIYRLSNIAKIFHVGKLDIEALKDISISLSEGEFVALQGPSGSGKSTLLNILGLIDRPTRGSIRFFDQDLDQADETKLTCVRQSHIGFIFQNFNLVPVLSAVENVEYALYLEQQFTRAEVRDRARACIASVGLERFGTHKPAELSGGQRQRVAIARALVKNPKLIIADEPTANLDSKTAMQILQLVRNLQESSKTTVIVATHDKTTADMAGRIIRIKDGLLEN